MSEDKLTKEEVKEILDSEATALLITGGVLMAGGLLLLTAELDKGTFTKPYDWVGIGLIVAITFITLPIIYQGLRLKYR